MPSFSDKSMEILRTCDPRLQKIFTEVIHDFDCTVISGHRGEEEQNELVRKGLSQLSFPQSNHNLNPSLAADVIPYPADWKDRERFNFFAGFVMGTAMRLSFFLRWGGDWDGDWQVKDNNFDDLAHFELVTGWK